MRKDSGGENMESRVMRPGKTRKDRLIGAWANHLENRETRRAWNQEYMSSSKAGGLKVIPYPKVTH